MAFHHCVGNRSCGSACGPATGTDLVIESIKSPRRISDERSGAIWSKSCRLGLRDRGFSGGTLLMESVVGVAESVVDRKHDGSDAASGATPTVRRRAHAVPCVPRLVSTALVGYDCFE